MNPHDAANQYRAAADLFIDSRGRQLSAVSLKELVVALFSARGAASFLLQPQGQGVVDAEARVLPWLEVEDLRMCLSALNLDQIGRRLRSFLAASEEAGGDVALIEPDEEADELAGEGERLLWERHEVECQIEGIESFLRRNENLASEVAAEMQVCRRTLTGIDELWKRNIVDFVPLNAFRRSLAQQYGDAERFWWWHLRVECDLAAVYRSIDGGTTSAHLSDCPYCSALLQSLNATKAALQKSEGPAVEYHPTTAEIVRLFFGETSGAQEQAVDWHVRACSQCRWEMETLQRGELDELQERDEAVAQEPDEPHDRVASSSEPVVYVFTLSEAPLAAAADTASGEGKVRGLPGRFMFSEGDVKIWVDRKRGRALLRVFGAKLEALGDLEITDHDTFDSCKVAATVAQTGEAQFDLGSTDDLEGKRLRLQLSYEGRPLLLLRLDLLAEQRR